MSKRFWIFFIALGLCLASWFTPFFRQYWDLLDQTIYIFLNGLLHLPYAPQIVGGLSLHATDFIFDCVMAVAFFFCMKKKGVSQNTLSVFFQLIIAFVYIFFFFYLTKNVLFPAYLTYDRLSPSLVLQGISIREMISFGHYVKTEAHYSFPGNHALTFFMWCGFMCLYGGWRWRIGSICLAIFFSLPRLIVGAHWFTDVFVGGLFLALFCLMPAVVFSFVEKGAAVFVSWYKRWLKPRDKSLS